MKKAYRLLSLVVTTCLLLSCAGVLSASAEETPTLLFDMDLTNFDPASTETARGITNSVTGSADGIELMEGVRASDGAKAGAFAEGSYANAEGAEIPYAELVVYNRTATSISASTNARIWIDDEAWHGKSFTAEIWMNTAYYSYANHLSVYDGQAEERTNTLTDKVSLGHFNNTSLWYLGKDTNRKTLPQKGGEWVQVVITRTIEDGVAKHAAYVNGTLAFAASGAAAQTAPAESGRAGVLIGSIGNSNAYTSGSLKVADVKVYDGVLTETDIAEHFAAGRADFDIAAPNSVVGTDGAVMPDAESFTVTMAADIDSAEAAKVVLRKKADNAVVPATIAAAGTTLTVTPGEYLAYHTDYVLDFSPLYCDDTTVTTAANAVSVQGTPARTGDVLSFTLLGDAAAHNLTVLAVGYDASGKLCGAVSKPVSLTGASHQDTLEREGLGTWSTVTFMVWENGDGYTRPLTDAITLP